MSKVILRRAIICLGIALSLVACGLFPESSFELAHESRLPKWFVLPPGVSRSEVTVTMSYYVKSSGRTAEFVLRDAKKQKLSDVVGTQKGLEPIRMEGTSSVSSPSYPMYELITVGGMTEVIEHRRMEPVFYIVEDPTILTKLGVGKKGSESEVSPRILQTN